MAVAELHHLLRSPARAVDFVLADHGRLAASIARGQAPLLLSGLLLACSLVASLPYALANGWTVPWRIGALYSGSVLVCWPSLQVFGSFLGIRLHPTQSLQLSLLIAAAASIFTLGFAPIVWFLRATMRSGDWVDVDSMYRVLLVLALLGGIGQLGRCIGTNPALRGLRAAWPLLVAWQGLVLFITWRMARTLGLVA